MSLDFEPHGVAENVGEAVGAVGSGVADSLERFKEFIEDRGAAQGGWRGQISDGVPLRGSGSGGTTQGDADVPVDLPGQDANVTQFGEPRGVRGF